MDKVNGKFKTFMISLVTVIVTSATTAFLDWSYAKIVEVTVNVPITTPVGTYQQEIKIQQKRGRFSNHLYK